jgi:ABC-type antimicrobial peptide transport system permease subunit
MSVLRNAVLEVDPDQPAYTLQPMQATLEAQITPMRRYVGVFGGFAVLAIILAAVGLYGTVSYLVERRLQEIAIRMALGARGSDVYLLVLRDSARYFVPGVVGGAVLAFVTSRIVGSLLFGIEDVDLTAFVLAVVALLGVVATATSLPALRALRADPASVLRST